MNNSQIIRYNRIIYIIYYRYFLYIPYTLPKRLVVYAVVLAVWHRRGPCILLFYNNMFRRTPVPHLPSSDQQWNVAGTEPHVHCCVVCRPDERPVPRPAFSTKTLPVPVAIHSMRARETQDDTFCFRPKTDTVVA